MNNIESRGFVPFTYSPEGGNSLKTTRMNEQTNHSISSLGDYVISEIEINTPDSIQLAYDALNNKSVECLLLKDLLDLQKNTKDISRDVVFAQKVEQLKNLAIQEIRDIFSTKAVP